MYNIEETHEVKSRKGLKCLNFASIIKTFSFYFIEIEKVSILLKVNKNS